MNSNIFISKDDAYLFGEGTHYEIYKKLGAHPSEEDGKKGFHFAVWAPDAKAVHLVGEFNAWNETAHPLKKMESCGIWKGFFEGIKENELYKFLITARDGRKLYKADPYANYAELRPGTASRTFDISSYKWGDKKYYTALVDKDAYESPMAIYECHIGSWMKHPDGTEDGFYNYREFADHLIEYLKDMKYTHVELMGISEHPFDGSWGYQVTGYYAPTSRYGTPTDFMYLVDTLHKNGIGVLLDWVPAHFCSDEHGLAEFDGSCIYEDPDPRKGQHPEWGTRIFNLEKNEVRNFLTANALYWIEEFHVDGLRVDAVASMLYLDYSKKDGEWVANKYGGHENLAAIDFFKNLNGIVKKLHPQALMIAEESTAWPKITAPAEEGGLDFSFKWSMGWMHDFCGYMKLDPYFRKNAHHQMTFAMSYNSSEKYILPLSHDEVVHLKCSMVEKMPGYKVDKYANLRAGYAYMFGHAGKKLLFMGQDFGQEREWSEARELDWFLLKEDLNKGLKAYVSDLLKLYNEYPCLYKYDHSWDGFEWINADDIDRSIYSFMRKDHGKKEILFVMNMTPVERKSYRVGVPRGGSYKKLMDSCEKKYAGAGSNVKKTIEASGGECDKRDFYLEFDMQPYGAYAFLIPDLKKDKNKLTIQI